MKGELHQDFGVEVKAGALGALSVAALSIGLLPGVQAGTYVCVPTMKSVTDGCKLPC